LLCHLSPSLPFHFILSPSLLEKILPIWKGGWGIKKGEEKNREIKENKKKKRKFKKEKMHEESKLSERRGKV
jgi:hypothetical protein